LPLDELAVRLNQQHYEDGTQAQLRYVTAAFLRLHAESSEIEMVNAGHNPAALVRPDGSVLMIKASGTPLGMLPVMNYKVERFAFPAGSRILLYTDGLTEVFRGDAEFDEEFGEERLVAAFRDHSSGMAAPILDHLWETLGSFSMNAQQRDDMTALVVCHLDSSAQECATV
jgi:serine phosphatase RsbU (regulator of sigma subunit)